jgi:hypothetical protein
MSIRALLCLVAVSLGLWGCGKKEEYRQFSDTDNVENTAPPAEHHHPEHGPNGGHVVVLGDHAYHAELVLDPTTLNVSVYLLEHDMATATPVADAGMLLKLEGAEPIALTAEPNDGDPEGKSSRFSVTGDKLPATVKGEEDLHGSLELTVGGQAHSGAIAHEHDHAEHGHDDHKHE